MSHEVFISHSIKEKDEDAANRIYDHLRSMSIICFMDKRDLIGGVPYHIQISNAIKTSKLVVLVFSTDSDASPNVQNEIAMAAGFKIPIVPVRIEDKMPKDLLFFIATPQWVEAFSSPLEKHFPKLVKAVKYHLNKEPVDDTVSEQVSKGQGEAKSTPKSSSKWVIDITQDAQLQDEYKPAPKASRWITDSEWHDIPYHSLSQWVKIKANELKSGKVIKGRTFLYRYNYKSHQFQKRLK